MAIRPVFSTDDKAPFYKTTNVEFVWNRGLSKSQKQKNISAIHKVFRDANPNKKVLEISSKSMQEGGEMLSAFFIKKYVSSLDHTVPVECIYQAGKVFEDGGPYLDLLGKSPKEAKKDKRLKTSGRLTGFKFAGKDFPICPKTFFYDYIYMNALLENPKLADILLQYDAFTDIEYNPNKNINCQARSAATFVSLSKKGLLDFVKDPISFMSLYETDNILFFDSLGCSI